MNIEDKVDRMEGVIVLLKELIVRHEERLDNHEERHNWFEADLKRSREDFDFKMNALINAQIKNESEIEKLELASSSQLNRIERLEQI